MLMLDLKEKLPDTKDRIESAGDDFFEKVRAGYLEIAKDHDYIKVVDADDDPLAIHKKIISLIAEINHD
jgi:dTMP kinase